MKAWVLLLAVPLAAAPPVFKVQIRNRTVDMPLEKYVAAAVAGESSVFRSTESLKAMAVAARSYAVRLRGRHAGEGFDFCASTHCQRLDPEAVTARIETAVADTAGELLWFAGKPAFACYTRDCGGRTEDSAAVWPDLAASYLKSHDDPWCQGPPWQWTADPQQLADALRRSQLRTPARVERISIAERTASGRARTLLLHGQGDTVRISAGSFRFAVGREIGWNTVLSDRYEIRTSSGKPVFDGAGSGHGVGLCQRGADQMGLAGKPYREILAFYYPGTAVGLTARGISWQRLGGDGIAVMTTAPGRDRAVLAQAERIARQSPVPVPRDIEVRIYPDVDTFRNATGEPGWVAAYSVGRRIHLQPLRATSESTLRHELLHVAVESQASAALPLWFREGLVEYLAGARAGGAGKTPSDDDLRQTTDPARARRAYAAARTAVAAAVNRYGLPTVLGWLKAGLPPELKNAGTSHVPATSR